MYFCFLMFQSANYSREKASRTHSIGDYVRPRAGLSYLEQTNFLPLPGTEPLFLGILACSLVIIPTESYRLPNRFVSTINQTNIMPSCKEPVWKVCVPGWNKVFYRFSEEIFETLTVTTRNRTIFSISRSFILVRISDTKLLLES